MMNWWSRTDSWHSPRGEGRLRGPARIVGWRGGNEHSEKHRTATRAELENRRGGGWVEIMPKKDKGEEDACTIGTARR